MKIEREDKLVAPEFANVDFTAVCAVLDKKHNCDVGRRVAELIRKIKGIHGQNN